MAYLQLPYCQVLADLSCKCLVMNAYAMSEAGQGPLTQNYPHKQTRQDSPIPSQHDQFTVSGQCDDHYTMEMPHNITFP